MVDYLKHIGILAKRLAIVLVIFTICRILFWIFNASYFQDVTASVFLGGLRFDLSAIVILNSPLIIFHLIPFPFRSKKWYQTFLKVLFLVINSLLITFNLIDLEYFKFTFKRSTADLLQLITLGDDVANLLPQFMIDYWYIPLILVVLIVLMNYLFGQIQLKPANNPKTGIRYYIVHSVIFVIGVGLSVVIARGGTQYVPINIMDASQYATTQNIPLVLNTPFAIMKTVGKSNVETQHYFSEEQADSYFNTKLHIKSSGENPNFVILILESFSEEYVGALNGNLPTYTPFLDSLINNSIRFEAGYANGRKSVEAMPAIVSNVPALMTTPYIQSAYGGNSVTALPEVLGEMGYSTSFYHGGNNGTMGFDAFAYAAGFDRYVGRDEYPYDGDYDGNWGIFDEPFLQFYADELEKEKQPFMSCMFTLSSHHPFKIPEQYKNKFNGADLPLKNSIRYADHALKKFFEKARKASWFENTWFILTADHTSIPHEQFYRKRVGSYRVPIAFYHPKKEGKRMKGIIQHTDIMPSVLHLSNYEGDIIRFGYNVFEEENRYAFGYINNTYHIIDNRYIVGFDGKEVKAIFDYKNDPLLQENLVKKGVEKPEMLKTLKSVIQQFNDRLISNNLVLR